MKLSMTSHETIKCHRCSRLQSRDEMRRNKIPKIKLVCGQDSVASDRLSSPIPQTPILYQKIGKKDISYPFLERDILRI
jgi:hypothetical protein